MMQRGNGPRSGESRPSPCPANRMETVYRDRTDSNGSGAGGARGCLFLLQNQLLPTGQDNRRRQSRCAPGAVPGGMPGREGSA